MAQKAFEIPLSPKPQTFKISLSLIIYQLTVVWNTVTNLWTVDIADENAEPIVRGIPLITGANLLEQYDYLAFPGKLYAQTDGSPDTPPTWDNLGINGHLYFVIDQP